MKRNTSEKRWRGWLRFSLRSLVVVVLVLGLWLGSIVRSARLQQEAVAAILKLQGTARYDWERKDGRNLKSGGPSAPKWLVDLVGVDYFSHVTQVRLVATPQLSEKEITLISQLSGLEELDLHRSPITDRSLEKFAGLTSLQSLTLFHTDVGDPGLKHLRRMSRLRILSLENTRVTDQGATALQSALPKLSIKR
jgi:hypothetical protein